MADKCQRSKKQMAYPTCRIEWHFLKYNQQPGEDMGAGPAFGKQEGKVHAVSYAGENQ